MRPGSKERGEGSQECSEVTGEGGTKKSLQELRGADGERYVQSKRGGVRVDSLSKEKGPVRST